MAGRELKLKELQGSMVTWYGGMILFLQLPCMSGLHTVLSGRNRMHAVISVFTFPSPSLAFSQFYLAHFLFARCYCPSISTPSVFVHHLSLLSIYPALQKSGVVSPQKQSLHHTGCKCSVNFQVKKWGKKESFKAWECFHFTREKKEM